MKPKPSLEAFKTAISFTDFHSCYVIVFLTDRYVAEGYAL